jgi:hypothetical protein
MRFSAAVLEARAQLMEYGRYFDERKYRDAIYKRYGLKTWMPRMFLVMGRLGSVDPFDRRKIEVSTPDLYLLSYDEIMSRMKGRFERLKNGKP